MTPHALIHWLEQGSGRRWLARGTLLLGLGLLSVVVASKQFQGPRTEETLRQAVLARELSAGQGFTTLVRYPQSAALLAARDPASAPERALPEMYHPPGYALVLAAALAILPEPTRHAWSEARIVPPDGWRLDYLLLAVNVLLLWVAAGQTWRLGCRLFDERTGVLAAVAVVLSVPLWRHVAAVDGTSWAMVLGLALFQALAGAETSRGGRRWGWLAAAGASLAGLALTDYCWFALVPLAVVYVGWRQRVLAAGVVLGTALLLVSPWLLRNVAATGHPLGLAAHDLALVQGDAQAEPAIARTLAVTDPPPLRWEKVGRKLLGSADQLVRERLWSSGGLLFAGLFVAGWLYRFRRDDAQGLRMLVTIALVGVALVQGTTNSGEGERHVPAVLAPMVILFGAAFFWILVAGSPARRGGAAWAVALLLAGQAAPLLHDLLEPRRIHFTYPPYHAPLFQHLADGLVSPGDEHPSWMADVPAGAAWYSGLRVWAQPAELRQLYVVHAEQPLVALVLTPRTLDRPYFADLAVDSRATTSRFGEWERIYRGLAREQLPLDFPLRRMERIADNFIVLFDPQRPPWRGNSVAPGRTNPLRAPGQTATP